MKTTLPANSRMAILKMYVDGLSIRQISELTRVNPGTIQGICTKGRLVSNRQVKPVPNYCGSSPVLREQVAHLNRVIARLRP